MSPATKSKSKSKEKPLTKAAKELQKASQKYPESTNGSTPASAYNPLSGTFHSLDTASGASSPPLQSNGRFRNIEETDNHSGNLHKAAVEYDSLSNNDSCSGESEDHKEKATSTAVRQDVVTVSDNEKREKIRQKNERKHQRQRERRAQELHERCSGYLMSRKLESLSQQIVAMGFTSERATMALMLNEGRLQESVNWLFEGTEQESQTKDIGSGANLKIDITEELARISEMEARHKCSKQEVERVVVSCEGDLDKAEETLNSQKPEPITHPKPEESASLKHTMMHQEKPTSAVTTLLNRNEGEMAYSKGAVALPAHPVTGARNQLSSKIIPSKPQMEKRVSGNAYNSSQSYSTAPIQVASSSAKVMAQLGVGLEGRSFQQGAAVKEPIVMMQRPQSINIKPSSVINSSASPPGTNQWYGNNVMGADNMILNGKLVQSQSSGNFGTGSHSQHFYPQAQSRNPGLDNPSSRQYSSQAQYMQQRAYMSNSVDPVAARPVASSWSTVGTSSSPSLTVPSSLGLFSGFGSGATSGLPSHVDWNARDMMSHCDYNSIDWTLKSSPLSPPKLNELMLEDRSGGLMRGLSSMRSTNGVRVAGLQDGVPTEATKATTSGIPREWTSPFAGKDIFSLPRQFVTSPSP